MIPNHKSANKPRSDSWLKATYDTPSQVYRYKRQDLTILIHE